ncbi:hypothetical protein RND71_010880 [Anisodus tanguticus]|uniref:Uncharacterized protein n=1 Tax=Anisodus tanguticus TaxID=243964 RepID=A0AAE1SKL7_9SOLA|nr:hypothetical protein RND71_010880 [Anisodus tanguticus]
MKSKIRVMFESLISCGKPTKGNNKDQGPVVIDEPAGNAQGQRHQDEPKHAQGQGHVVKDEPKNAQIQMVKYEPKKAKEQVEGAFVYRTKITTYRRIIISSRQAKPTRKRPPPPPQTGKVPNK